MIWRWLFSGMWNRVVCCRLTALSEEPTLVIFIIYFYLSTKHGISSKKTVNFLVTAIRIMNIAWCYSCDRVTLCPCWAAVVNGPLSTSTRKNCNNWKEIVPVLSPLSTTNSTWAAWQQIWSSRITSLQMIILAMAWPQSDIWWCVWRNLVIDKRKAAWFPDN